MRLRKKDISRQAKSKCRYIPVKRKYIDIITNKRDVNTSKLIVASVSRDTTNAKTTRTSSKNPVQKRHLSLYGPPYASTYKFHHKTSNLRLYKLFYLL